MTLVVTVYGKETTWMLADCRISFADRLPKDDAVKMMSLETRDGAAMISYAGLGLTAAGTEPSEWMSAVLRGRNLLMEESLNALAAAMEREFPAHLLRLPSEFGAKHAIVVAARIHDEPMVYSIDMAYAPDRTRYSFRVLRRFMPVPGREPKPVPILVGGSGTPYLLHEKTWIRNLMHVVRACDEHRISTEAVADFLARSNNDVHIKEPGVGPRCIVKWMYTKRGPHEGGGASLAYMGPDREDGTVRADGSGVSPAISHGMNVGGLIRENWPYWQEHMQKMMEQMFLTGQVLHPDENILRELAAKVPMNPDERLK